MRRPLRIGVEGYACSITLTTKVELEANGAGPESPAWTARTTSKPEPTHDTAACQPNAGAYKRYVSAESGVGAHHRTAMLLEPAQRIDRRYLNPVPTKVGGLSLMFKVLSRFLIRAKSRFPDGPLGTFHTGATIYAATPRSGPRITWMGHSTSIIEIDGVRVLIDPVWDDRASPTNWSGPKRLFPAPLGLSDLPTIDAIIVSHDHYDHLGAGTIRALAHMAAVERARWIMPVGVGALLKQLGAPAANCVELNWLDNTQVGAVLVQPCQRAIFLAAASSIALKRCGPHLRWPGSNIVFTMEPIPESGRTSARSGSSLGRSTWPCLKLVLSIRCGRVFTWAGWRPAQLSCSGR